MTWLRVDDSFESHPKVRTIPRRHRLAAVGLWTLAGSWCARHLTDGRIPMAVIEELGGTPTLVRLLVEARLWVEEGSTEARPDAGQGSTEARPSLSRGVLATPVYEFHDWEDWQPTREKVTKRRQDSAARQAAWRERAGQRRAGKQGDGQETHHGDAPVTRDERVSDASTGGAVTRESQSPVPSLSLIHI